MTELQIAREWLDWDSTGADLVVEREEATLRIPGISLEARAAAIEMVRGSLAAGTPLVDAVEASLGVSLQSIVLACPDFTTTLRAKPFYM